jgi:hypothetical protein
VGANHHIYILEILGTQSFPIDDPADRASYRLLRSDTTARRTR